MVEVYEKTLQIIAYVSVDKLQTIQYVMHF